MSFQVSLQRVRPLQRRSGSRGMQVTHGGFHCEVGTKRSGNTEVGFVFSGMQVSGRAFFNILGSFLIY